MFVIQPSGARGGERGGVESAGPSMLSAAVTECGVALGQA